MQGLRAVLSAVRNVTGIELNIFELVVFPALNSKVVRDGEAVVRIAFAESVGRLAETAKRFLDQVTMCPP